VKKEGSQTILEHKEGRKKEQSKCKQKD